MALPKIIARVSIPEKGKGEEQPYERFRGLVLQNINIYQNYTITKGGSHYDEHGVLVHEETGHLEHIHAYDKEKEQTGRLLASIRSEERFGEPRYVMEIYDRRFAEFVHERWGHVEFISKEKKDEIEEKPGGRLLASKR